MSTFNSYRVDDRDSFITYSSYGPGLDWQSGGVQQEYKGTTSLAQKKGANATITFFGTSIGVYGTTSSEVLGGSASPTTYYILDRGAPTSFTARALADVQYNVLFYQSPDLTPGEHVLEIINQSEGGLFWLDYAVVGNTIPSTTSSSSASLTLTEAHTSTSSPAARNSGPPGGVVVGGVIGATLGFTLIFLIFLWWLRKKRAAAGATSSSRLSLFSSPPRSVSPNQTEGPQIFAPLSLVTPSTQSELQAHGEYTGSHPGYESSVGATSEALTAPQQLNPRRVEMAEQPNKSLVILMAPGSGMSSPEGETQYSVAHDVETPPPYLG